MGFHHNTSISQLSGEDIFPSVADNEISIVKVGTFSRYAGTVTIESNHSGSGSTPLSVQIVFCKIHCVCMKLGVLIDDHFNPQRGAIHKQHGNQQHEGSYDNADFFKTPVR